MSDTVKRRCGSKRKDCRAISPKGGGTVSGKSGSPCRSPSPNDGFCVNASTSVNPSDHTSPAGDKPEVVVSGGSYGVRTEFGNFSLARHTPSLEIFNFSSTAITFDGLSRA